jgi:hypothetical protein
MSPFSIAYVIQKISSKFKTSWVFYGEELLVPHPTLKLYDHPFLAVRDYLFNIFTAALHIWGPSPLSII